MQQLAAQYIVDIINNEMSMPAQRVWIRNQGVELPNDQNLFIVVGMISSDVIGNTVTLDTGNNEQLNQVIRQERLQVDIVSRNNDALTRNWEVIAAMQSFYSQQVQELNNFKIFRIPNTLIDTSFAEGGSQLNRYTVVLTCHVWYRKEQALNTTYGDYYDQFEVRVDDEATIGTENPAIEFEINAETPPPPYP